MESLVSIESFVASAKQQLKIGDTGAYDIWFEKLANEGIKRLGCLSLQHKKVGVFEICDNKVKIPSGLLKILGVKLGSNDNCSTAIMVDMPFIKDCGCNINSDILIANTFERNNGFLVFHQDIDDFTDCTIAYTAYNTDKNGLMQAQDEYESAITYFICYHYCLQNYEKYPKQITDEYWHQWLAQRRIIINSDFVRSARETKAQIQEWMNALVTDKNSWL